MSQQDPNRFRDLTPEQMAAMFGGYNNSGGGMNLPPWAN